MSGYRTIPAGSERKDRLLPPREPRTKRGLSVGHTKWTETVVDIRGPKNTLENVDLETTGSGIRLIVRRFPVSYQPSPDPRHQPADRITHGSTGYPEERRPVSSCDLPYPPESSYGGHQLTQPITPRLPKFRPTSPQVTHHPLRHPEHVGGPVLPSQQPSSNYLEVPRPIPVRPSSAPPTRSMHSHASRRNSRSRAPTDMDRSSHSDSWSISGHVGRSRSPSPFQHLEHGAHHAYDASYSLADSLEDEGYGSQDNTGGHRSMRRERSRGARDGRYHKRSPARDYGRLDIDDFDGYCPVEKAERLERRTADSEENQWRRRS
jgi:hypothetical protein